MGRPTFVIGVDESGRGPLAGPVTVGAVLMPHGTRLYQKPAPFRDSKKLSPLQRSLWLAYIQDHQQIMYRVAWAKPQTIDTINITQAVNRAATRAVRRLLEGVDRDIYECRVVVDAGISIYMNDLNIETVIRGDERRTAVKLASIIAKTHQDRAMQCLHRSHEQYRFDKHKGYGTAEHRAYLKQFGPSPVHRQSYLSFLERS